MRLLHAGTDHVGDWSDRRRARRFRPGHPRTHERQSLSLWCLRQHRCRHTRRRREGLMLPFGYAQASGLSQAIAFAGSHEQAMFIAGGTDMLQLLQETVVRPRTLVDINALPLAGI